MSGTDRPEIVRFVHDMTLRWSCRQGDFLIWMRYANVFANRGSLQVLDLWEMGGGEFVTITNRMVDLPAWFQLHPTETRNALASQMMLMLEQGYEPGGPIEGPNIWRLRSGDRVAWMGAARPERQAVNGILSILDCHDCALAAGEFKRVGIEGFLGFGSPSTSEMKPEDNVRFQAAVRVAQELGLPRTWETEWVSDKSCRHCCPV